MQAKGDEGERGALDARSIRGLITGKGFRKARDITHVDIVIDIEVERAQAVEQRCRWCGTGWRVRRRPTVEEGCVVAIDFSMPCTLRSSMDGAEQVPPLLD